MKDITQKIKELKAKRQRMLIEMYCSGIYSHDEVAHQIGINYGTARSFFNLWKNRYDFPAAQPGNVGIPKKRKVSKLRDNIQEAYTLYKKGKSLDEVGKLYGDISRESVRQMFKKHGLKTRSNHERLLVREVKHH